MATTMTATQREALRLLASPQAKGEAVLGMKTGWYGNLVIQGATADALTARGYATQAGAGGPSPYTIVTITQAGRERAASLDSAESAVETQDPGYCRGCGQHFRGVRGLRSHQAGRFQTLACRPVKED